MNEPPGPPAIYVDVFVSVPAATRLEDVTCPAGLDQATCFARHRIEWRATGPGPKGLSTWHFRAPDAESVRIVLRRAGIRFDTLRSAHPEPSR